MMTPSIILFLCNFMGNALMFLILIKINMFPDLSDRYAKRRTSPKEHVAGSKIRRTSRDEAVGQENYEGMPPELKKWQR
jgi:hypothetical protein